MSLSNALSSTRLGIRTKYNLHGRQPVFDSLPAFIIAYTWQPVVSYWLGRVFLTILVGYNSNSCSSGDSVETIMKGNGDNPISYASYRQQIASRGRAMLAIR